MRKSINLSYLNYFDSFIMIIFLIIIIIIQYVYFLASSRSFFQPHESFIRYSLFIAYTF